MSDMVLDLVERTEGANPRQIRANGDIPVTVYGKSMEQSLSMQISERAFLKIRNSRFVQVLNVKLNGQDARLLIKKIEKNPVTDKILNIQFQMLTEGELVSVTVPIILTGQSPLVQAGGNMFVNNKSVTLLCPVNNIPTKVDFDLSQLKDTNNFAYYSDLQLPEGVDLKSDKSQVIVKVSIPQVATA